MHDPGAAFAASAICAALQAVIIQGDSGRSDHAIAKLPPPLHARPWGRGRREEVQPKHLSFFYGHSPTMSLPEQQALQQQLVQKHTQVDMDPLDNMQRKAWWLLYPGKDRAEFAFKGTRLGILTMIGPDSAIWSARLMAADGANGSICATNGVISGGWRSSRWSRTSAKRRARRGLVFEAEVPDRSVWSKQPSGPFWQQVKAEGKEHKLWLMHWLVEEESEKERAVVRREATAQAATRRSLARGWEARGSRRAGGGPIRRCFVGYTFPYKVHSAFVSA